MADANEKDRILVLETSALLAVLNNFTDPYNHSTDVFETLLQPPPGRSGKPVARSIMIPDHVFYECTGILANSIPRMLELLVATKHDPEKFEQTIEFYVTASPRTGVGVKNRDTIKDQIRTLLRFIADHPDCLGYDLGNKQWVYQTNVTKHYLQRLKADHAVLGGTGVSVPDDYRVSIGNVMDALGKDFDVDKLRIHAGQLYMMGFYTEDEYNERMGRNPPSMEKPRFLDILEFSDHLHKKSRKGWVTQQRRDAMKSWRDRNRDAAATKVEKEFKGKKNSREAKTAIAKAKQDASYLTVEFLKQFPDLLELYKSNYDQQLKPTKKNPLFEGIGKGEELVELAIRPSKMLIEHFIFGGVIPYEARFDVASYLGFDLDAKHYNLDERGVDKALDLQGFYERPMKAGELRGLYDYLKDKSQKHGEYSLKSLEKLFKLNDNLAAAVSRGHQRLDEACRNPRSQETSYKENMSIPTTGVPYEKVFTEELINGTITFNEFMEIVQRTGSLSGKFSDGTIGLVSEEILVNWDRQKHGEDSIIRVKQSEQAGSSKHGGSFISRSGVERLNQFYGEAGDTVPYNNNLYWRFTAGELLNRCREGRGYQGTKDDLERVFSGMLYRGVTQSASKMHDVAAAVLGEDRLVQLEKDFSNRHARRWVRHLPPYTSPFASMHVSRRISRKNLGEMATAEVASQLCQSHDQAQVIIVNHDSDLYPEKGTIRFSAQLKRMHGEKNHYIHELEQQIGELSESGQLQFLRSDQLLDTLCVLSNRNRPAVSGGQTRREPYPYVKLKEHISDHTNHDWRTRVHEPLTRTIQSYR